MEASVEVYRAKEKGRLRNGALNKIIEDAKDKYGVPENVFISRSTIRR